MAPTDVKTHIRKLIKNTQSKAELTTLKKLAQSEPAFQIKEEKYVNKNQSGRAAEK